MTAIIAVSLTIIGLVLAWLCFGYPPQFFRPLFYCAVVALLSCGLYKVLIIAGL